MQIQNNSVVSFHYTLTNKAGDTIDSSEGHEPLAYIQGKGQIVPGLERAMEGKSIGANFQVVVSPEDGYGQRDDSLMDSLPIDAFAGVPEVQEGMEFYADGPQGPVVLTVCKVEGDKVLVDANHPLAGEELHFDIQIAEVRVATAEELEHGHVHGAGGHHHD